MVVRALMAVVVLYQRTLSRFVRLFYGRTCRFEPSCSRYALACLEAHGACRGSLLSLLRMCKCHPFHPGGYDPPPRRAAQRRSESAPEAG